MDHRLARGLDYYNRTVFEIVPPDGGAQSTVGGGGRYDYLAETLGGPHLPGVGFGSGIERILLNRRPRRSRGSGDAPPPPEVYVAPLADAALPVVTTVAAGLRRAGIAVEVGYAAASPRSHLRRANAVGARVALIVGNREVESRARVPEAPRRAATRSTWRWTTSCRPRRPCLPDRRRR